MKYILRWLSWQKIIFLIVLGVVIFQNRITGNQYLSGWDNLQPEINFGLELSRQLSAVWQEFRGLGHLGGMGHAADLPRTLILWVFSWVVPTNLLRWGWHVAMLTLGPIGIWYMGRRLWKWSESASLTAGMFYLLNMATVQYFYTPYEAFSAFYGFLPWLISSFVLFLENGNKQDGMRLLLVSLLATTAFYVQTLFVVYVMLLFIISLGYLKNWKRILQAGLIVFAANAFWLLPVIYFVISNAGVVGVSKINSIASPETAYMNEAMGGWREVLSMKGFWLEYVEWKGKDWGRLLQVWQEWSSRNIVQILSLSIAGLSILGVVVGAIKKRISWWISVMFILTFIMLASNNPPFGFAYTYLTEKIPFFGEMFRSVFTKWSVVMGMVLALGLGVTVELARTKKGLATILTVLIVGMVGYILWPVFGGNLIFKPMKVEYPSEYSQLYTFFDEQDKSGRIAYLPSAWAWGWQYHDWGYRGSGFLWYGIEQPILDRAFDVWSPYNEGFYNEISTALYGDTKSVKSVLDKYDVKYVLLDESVIAPGQDKKVLRNEETKELAKNLGWQEKFHEGFLTVWEVPGETQNQFVSAVDSYTNVEADTVKVRQDVVWSDVGTYVTTNSQITHDKFSNETYSASIYPFAHLMREELQGLEYSENNITVRSNLLPAQAGSLLPGSELIMPAFKQGEQVEMGYLVRMEEGKVIVTFKPLYTVNGQPGPTLPETSIIIPQSESNAWVAIGSGRQNAVFIEKGKEVTGTTNLVVGSAIPLFVYTGTTSTTDKLGSIFTPGHVQMCWRVEDDSLKKAAGSVVDGALKLVTRNASACLPIQLAPSKANELIQVIAQHKSPDNVRPSMCLDLAGEPYRCENQDLTNNVPASADWAGFMRTVRSEQGQQYWLDLSSESLEPRDVERALYYQVPLVARYKEIASDTIEASAWESYVAEHAYLIITGGVEIVIPSAPFRYDFPRYGRLQPANCDVLKRGEATKNGATYTADHYGVVCDYVEMPELSTKLSYLLRLAGEDKQGRSVKFFLADTGSNRNDLEYLLGKGRFDQTFPLIPWNHDGHYFLNIETRSFGNATVNSLDTVEARYFPLDVIARARTQGDSAHRRGDLAIKSVSKSGTWLYRVASEGNGLMKLSQGYDKGWIAIGITNNKGIDLEHVKVDGWASGWMVPEGVTQVIIMYWPQLLQYVGFALLAATLAKIALMRK